MAEDEPWPDPKSPQDARLASLDERLARAQAEEANRTGGREKKEGTAFYRSDLYRVSSVVIGAPLGCALIGVMIDSVAGTRGAWLVAILVGFVVAGWEVWKLSKQKPEGAEGSD
jgi:ATP synthase protein I